MTVTREWLFLSGVKQWIESYDAMEKEFSKRYNQESENAFTEILKTIPMPDYIFIHAIQRSSDNVKTCESHKNFENIAYFLGNTNFSKEEQEGGTIIKFTCEVCKQEIYFKRKTEKTLLNK